ncbi:MAG: hypothetical protein ACSLFQ_01510 [Thermoanaerobaculia bacterium]
MNHRTPFVAAERIGQQQRRTAASSAPAETAEEKKSRQIAERVRIAELNRKLEASNEKLRRAIDRKIAPIVMRRLKKEGVTQSHPTFATRFMAMCDDEREKEGYPK